MVQSQQRELTRDEIKKSEIMALTGRELDAAVENAVMSNDLVPPRGYALARVGSSLVAITGPAFRLRGGIEIEMPHGSLLPQPDGTVNFNDRYMAYVAESLLGEHDYKPTAQQVRHMKDAVAAVRYDARLFSTDANAVREMEAQIERRGLWQEYVIELAYLLEIADVGVAFVFSEKECFAMMTASMETKCRAALLALLND